MSGFRMAIPALVLGLTCYSGVGAAMVSSPAPPEVIAASVTQGFYDWYRPLVGKPKVKAVQVALRQRRSLFSLELRRHLAENAAAAAKAKGTITGLDFDPFLNSQNPAEHYEAWEVTQRGKSYFVEVFGSSNGRRSSTPDVVAELVRSGTQWAFVNFHYPAAGKDQPKSDLLGILKQLRAGRKKHPE